MREGLFARRRHLRAGDPVTEGRPLSLSRPPDGDDICRDHGRPHGQISRTKPFPSPSLPRWYAALDATLDAGVPLRSLSPAATLREQELPGRRVFSRRRYWTTTVRRIHDSRMRLISARHGDFDGRWSLAVQHQFHGSLVPISACRSGASGNVFVPSDGQADVTVNPARGKCTTTSPTAGSLR